MRVLTLREDCCHLDRKEIRIYKDKLMDMIKVGLPAGIQGSLFSLSNVIVQSSVNSFGSVVVAGNAAAANIEGFVYVAMNAFSQTAVNYTGQNIGAGRLDRVRKIFFLCTVCVAVTGLVLGGGVYLAARPLLGIYITDSAEAIAYGIVRMSFVGLLYFLCGMMDVATGCLRGLGSSLVPMIISVLGVCGIRLGWIFTIFRDPRFHSLQSLFISYPISWTLTFLIEMMAFIVIYRRHVKRSAVPLTSHL
jgi:Na+-driven multidrug efflux pump